MKDNWILCSDRLPSGTEPEISCLVTYMEFDISENKFNSEKIGVLEYSPEFETWNGKALIEVLAWMPLPDPYKPE